MRDVGPRLSPCWGRPHAANISLVPTRGPPCPVPGRDQPRVLQPPGQRSGLWSRGSGQVVWGQRPGGRAWLAAPRGISQSRVPELQGPLQGRHFPPLLHTAFLVAPVPHPLTLRPSRPSLSCTPLPASPPFSTHRRLGPSQTLQHQERPGRLELLQLQGVVQGDVAPAHPEAWPLV